MLDALTLVIDGRAPISTAVAGHLLKHIRVKADQAPNDTSQESKPGLSRREVEVLHHLTRGMSHKEVAQVLGISPFTVGDHVKRIYTKMAVNTRGEAVYRAIKEGLALWPT